MPLFDNQILLGNVSSKVRKREKVIVTTKVEVKYDSARMTPVPRAKLVSKCDWQGNSQSVMQNCIYSILFNILVNPCNTLLAWISKVKKRTVVDKPYKSK